MASQTKAARRLLWDRFAEARLLATSGTGHESYMTKSRYGGGFTKNKCGGTQNEQTAARTRDKQWKMESRITVVSNWKTAAILFASLAPLNSKVVHSLYNG